MPIYAYKCSSCGHAQDVLQKVSDAPLAVCTACGATTFSKQLTAPGFHLKGNGWYATDFKNGAATKTETGKTETGKTETGKTETATPTKPDTATTADAKPATGTKAPAACGAGGCPAC
jgi:putative FmdB family regulatory protein